MRLIVNGEARSFAEPLTAEGLLSRMGIDPRRVAVERNLEIVPRSAHAATAFADGDRVEIVHFIGGGE